MTPYFADERAVLIRGEALDALRAMPDDSVDSWVTDPPAGISFMSKGWDSNKGGRDHWIAWLAEIAREALRVLKPGAHGLVWALPRTSHWTATALENAGFEIRDIHMHVFGSGFPKSLDVSKAIDASLGTERRVLGEGAAACEFIRRGEDCQGHGDAGQSQSGATKHTPATAPGSPDAAKWQGWGTALKPAAEHWILVRKPLAGTVAANVLEHGTGALNIDACRIGTTDNLNGGAYSGERRAADSPTAMVGRGIGEYVQPAGRWPAHVSLDEWYDRVVRLRDNAPEWLQEFLDDLGPVQGMQCTDPDFPESSHADEVLQSSVLREDAFRATAGGASAFRSEASAGVAGEDARSQASDGDLRTGEPSLGGSTPVARVRDDLSRGALIDGAGATSTDAARAALGTGAPTEVGTQARSTAPSVGSGAPQEWNQDGQPLAEPRAIGPRDAQTRASGDRARTATPEANGRDASRETRESSIPAAWLKYFTPTGRAVRCGAAAMLDEQSGELKTGGDVHHAGALGRMNDDGWQSKVQHHVKRRDTGGASRFFYVAKGSRSEKDRGCEHLPTKSGSEITGREEGSAGSQHARAGAGARNGARNHHPTVKSIALMRWLCRLITPPGGLVLDCFCGSGSTGVAAIAEGFSFVGVERDLDDETGEPLGYCEIIKARLIRALADNAKKEAP